MLDLKSAAADLKADTVLGDSAGHLLADKHVFMKKKEARRTRDLAWDALHDFYVYRV